MRVVIVGRDSELIEPLAELLTRANFDVVVVENIAGVQSCLKRGGIHFLAAEPALLLDYNLGREVLKRCPMARLLALAAQPSLLGMVDALSNGLTDYFPRSPEYFEQVVETLVIERRRLLRWQRILLSEAALETPEELSPAVEEDESGPPMDWGAESIPPVSEYEG